MATCGLPDMTFMAAWCDLYGCLWSAGYDLYGCLWSARYDLYGCLMWPLWLPVVCLIWPLWLPVVCLWVWLSRLPVVCLVWHSWLTGVKYSESLLSTINPITSTTTSTHSGQFHKSFSPISIHNSSACIIENITPFDLLQCRPARCDCYST